jgi:hypothetical protein
MELIRDEWNSSRDILSVVYVRPSGDGSGGQAFMEHYNIHKRTEGNNFDDSHRLHN